MSVRRKTRIEQNHSFCSYPANHHSLQVPLMVRWRGCWNTSLPQIHWYKICRGLPVRVGLRTHVSSLLGWAHPSPLASLFVMRDALPKGSEDFNETARVSTTAQKQAPCITARIPRLTGSGEQPNITADGDRGFKHDRPDHLALPHRRKTRWWRHGSGVRRGRYPPGPPRCPQVHSPRSAR